MTSWMDVVLNLLFTFVVICLREFYVFVYLALL